MRRTKALLSTTAVMVLMGAASFSVPASAAPGQDPTVAAVTCYGWKYDNLDASSGELTVGAYLKVGPYADCNNVVWMPAGTDVYYWCFVANDYGNTWSFVRIAGTELYGWVYDGHLNNGGSIWHCPI